MFKFAEIFKNALSLKQKIEEIQSELKKMRVEAVTGGGLVKVVADGQQNILEIKIDPELLKSGDIKLLEDLIVSAVNEARKKAMNLATAEMTKRMGDLPISKDVDPLLSS